MTLDPFYLLVGDYGWAERLVPRGVRLLQLRLKGADPEETARQIAATRALCAGHGCTLVVNDYWEQAIELSCDWVHLGQEDLDEADLPAIRRAGVRVGISTHDHDELERALSVDADYVALGPVYETKLKKMKWVPQGLGRVSEWKARIGSTPLVAIGGLDPERARGVLEAGADCAAVITDVVTNRSPEDRVDDWVRFVSATAVGQGAAK